MPSQVQALVVGAGISGLATAFALQKSGILTLTRRFSPACRWRDSIDPARRLPAGMRATELQR